MTTKASLYLSAAVFAVTIALTGSSMRLSAQQGAGTAVAIDADDIGGVVTGPNGPEAGVWVIAETMDLPSRMSKSVVTDDLGRYVIPDLPKANYSIWVRGYGLVDSPKVRSAPGKIVNLTAVPAPNDAAAAQYYPAIYWYAMLKIPPKSEFSGAGGTGMQKSLKTQEQYLDLVKTDGCYTCHQLGNEATRTVEASFSTFKTSMEAWERRIQSGQAMATMTRNIGGMDAKQTLAMLADWTDRIAEGELPATKPPRPQGLERNVVITVWDWATPTSYLHDENSTDKRNPTVNANGKIYGSPEESTDMVPIFDPVTGTASQMRMPVRDPATPSTKTNIMAPSPYWGDQPIWDSQTVIHNPMFDEKGRIWFTSRVGPLENPAFCKKGSDHPSAKLFPINESSRHLAMFDPKTNKITLIRTCFPTHHLQFGFDANDTLWTSQGGPQAGVVGWFNTKMFDETGDEEKSQGWTAIVLDTNGNGKRDDYVEPNQPVDPTKDKRITAAFYGVAPSPVDGSVWGSVLGYPGGLLRVSLGDNPPATAISEFFAAPADDPKNPGYSPRGMDIDSQGVVWAPLASGHMASFDRRKCKGPLNGPEATGKQCPEGWTLYPFPGPQLAGVTDGGSAEASYYTWVDQHNTFGLGNDTPFATGNANDSIIALKDGKMLNFVVPYPIGFYAKGMDGRIDDPNAGWKGRGIWSTTGNRTPFHLEGGKGTLPKLIHFQLRPDPLAK
jgi:hypothetical protein